MLIPVRVSRLFRDPGGKHDFSLLGGRIQKFSSVFLVSSVLLTIGFVLCREESFSFNFAFRVFSLSATSEFLCVLCLEILTLL